MMIIIIIIIVIIIIIINIVVIDSHKKINRINYYNFFTKSAHCILTILQFFHTLIPPIIL